MPKFSLHESLVEVDHSPAYADAERYVVEENAIASDGSLSAEASLNADELLVMTRVGMNNFYAPSRIASAIAAVNPALSLHDIRLIESGAQLMLGTIDRWVELQE